MFAPGETVTHRFTIPFVAQELKEVIVTYKQNSDVILKKTITSGFEENENNKTIITISMSQQESLLFQDNKDFTMQLNVFTLDGTRATSKEIKSSNGVQHYREVMRRE